MKVLKIGAIWCQECLVMKPMWGEIEAEMPDLVTEYIEADDNKDLLEKYKVADIPTFLFMDKDGNEILRLSGLQNKEDLLKVIEENLDK